MTPADIDRVFGRGRLRMVTGDHVEVFREHAAPGERRRYTKRFLATAAGDFSEYRVGLDHVSFGVADRGELEKWASRLDELGIDHGEIKDASYGSGLSFRDPDGIALEFFCAPAA